MDGATRVLPFSALVGQSAMTRALVLLAVNPRLPGLLLRGEKGTGKSVAARGLARLLPPVAVNRDCAFGCAHDRPNSWCADCRRKRTVRAETRRPPFATLPLGITEDQLLGTLDLERALKRGETSFAPGLLARVNHGLLYVDEVNLLDDAIVDLLLDVAASGVNEVAREGVAISHPADLRLVGTMNPEEGELRPQFQDRFGLCVEVRTITEPAQRAEIVERSLAFEADPVGVREQWSGKEEALTRRIAEARDRLAAIPLPRKQLPAVGRLAASLGVHGHRADLLLVKTAMTLAALGGRKRVSTDDLEEAATLVFPHRLRRRPFDEASLTVDDIREQAHAVLAGGEEARGKKARRPRRAR